MFFTASLLTLLATASIIQRVMKESALIKAAKVMSKHGARKGGIARAALLTADERKRIAKLGAQARWRTPTRERAQALLDEALRLRSQQS